jgi:DhnA family fructose-bisphosphate aldolase class Ia
VRTPPSRHAGLIIQLSGNTSHSSDGAIKATVCDVDTAVSLGADAVSMQLTLGASPVSDRDSLTLLGRVARASDTLGIPLLVMITVSGSGGGDASAICHAALAAIELGGDLVKIPAPGLQSLTYLCKSSPIPILVAGGPSDSCWSTYLADVQTMIEAGAAGVCVGRRLFQCDDPRKAARELRTVIHGE